MRIEDVRPEAFTRRLICDRCGREASLGDEEFQEFVCIDLKAGYGSIFGDGNDVQTDLCQHCLKETLGQWLRVVEPGEKKRKLAERLRQFDPDKHGGEFPFFKPDPEAM